MQIQQTDLIDNLLKLPHVEKLQIMNLLLKEVANEEGIQLETSLMPIKDKKTAFFQKLSQYNLTLPDDYQFDREEENAR